MGITPIQGDQLSFVFDKDPLVSKIDLSAYDSADLVGSHCDNLEESRIVLKFRRRKDTTWGEYDAGWLGEPLLPFDYSGQNHHGVRGGMVYRELSGIYVGPAYEIIRKQKITKVRASAFSGPIEFPFVKTNAKMTAKRVEGINRYVKEWRQWWTSEGMRSPGIAKECDNILDEIKRWRGVNLLHHCRPLTPQNDLEKRLLCPTSTIVDYLNDMLCEDF